MICKLNELRTGYGNLFSHVTGFFQIGNSDG
jgi:hypothetical protein